MPGDKTFVDTNVLVYAHDTRAGDRHRVAKELLEELWAERRGVVSLQVLQETYVSVTAKAKLALAPEKGREIVRAYGPWLFGPTELEHVLRATDLQEAAKLSFWDALIITTAAASGATVLVSEDLNDGQVVVGVRIKNPFVTSPST
jgi:predicted nucleic acid-binding protein